MPHGEPTHMQFIDDAVVPGRARSAIGSPGKRRIDHDRFRHPGTAVAAVERHILQTMSNSITEMRVAPLRATLDLLGIGIKKKLVVVEAHPFRGIEWAMDSITIELPGTRFRQITVPNLVSL